MGATQNLCPELLMVLGGLSIFGGLSAGRSHPLLEGYPPAARNATPRLGHPVPKMCCGRPGGGTLTATFAVRRGNRAMGIRGSFFKAFVRLQLSKPCGPHASELDLRRCCIVVGWRR